MGNIRHNAIIVTGSDYPDAIEKFDSAHQKARELFGELVSEPIEGVINGYRSFFVAPDGSKEGWSESDQYDIKRRELCDFIDSLAYGDGSNAVHFVDVGYDEGHLASVDRTNKELGEGIGRESMAHIC